MRRLNGIKMGFSDNISTDTDFIKFLLHWRKDLLYEDIQKLIQEPRPGNNKQNPEDNDIDLAKANGYTSVISHRSGETKPLAILARE